jgi:4-hydroxybenzoate polyprenyltransferase
MNMNFIKFIKIILLRQLYFTLPLAYAGILFAGGATPRTWIWVTTALTAAGVTGTSFTRRSEEGKSAVSTGTGSTGISKHGKFSRPAWITAIFSSLVLIGSSFMLNSLCFYLSFPAAVLFLLYSGYRRATRVSYVFPGFVEAAAPVYGYIAVTGVFDLLPLLLGLVIVTWITGLDIIYSVYNMGSDGMGKLISIPTIAGTGKALVISAFCYIASVFILAYAGRIAGMKFPFWLVLGLIAIIFVWQQIIVRKSEVQTEAGKYAMINVIISALLFTGTLLGLFF